MEDHEHDMKRLKVRESIEGHKENLETKLSYLSRFDLPLRIVWIASEINHRIGQLQAIVDLRRLEVRVPDEHSLAMSIVFAHKAWVAAQDLGLLADALSNKFAAITVGVRPTDVDGVEACHGKIPKSARRGIWRDAWERLGGEVGLVDWSWCRCCQSGGEEESCCEELHCCVSCLECVGFVSLCLDCDKMAGVSRVQVVRENDR